MTCAQPRHAEGALKSWPAFSQLYAFISADLLLDKNVQDNAVTFLNAVEKTTSETD